MSKQYKSPFATSFKNAVKRGTSYNQAVWNIATRAQKTPQFVWESLFKAGYCNRQKFNGQWIYWPSFDAKFTASTRPAGHSNIWQRSCEWCITSGWCTPEQFQKNAGSQAEFMAWCKKFFGKQFSATTPKAKSSTKTGRKSSSRKATTRRPKAKTTKARKTTTTAKAKSATKRSAPKRTATKRTATKSTGAKRTATKRAATKRASTKRTAAKRTSTKRAATKSAKSTTTKRVASKRTGSKSSYKFPTTTARRSSSKRYSRAA